MGLPVACCVCLVCSRRPLICGRPAHNRSAPPSQPWQLRRLRRRRLRGPRGRWRRSATPRQRRSTKERPWRI